MAKKTEITYTSWDDVNSAMKELAILNIEKRKIENEQSDQILKIKEYCENKASSLLPKIKQLEKNITKFVELNKAELATKRTKKLTFGTISYRQTKRIACKCIDVGVKVLKEFGMGAYIKLKETIDKDALQTLSDKELAPLVKAGITLVREDKLSIEPDYTELADLIAQPNQV